MESDIELTDKWICGKCKNENEIYLVKCQKCGKDFVKIEVNDEENLENNDVPDDGVTQEEQSNANESNVGKIILFIAFSIIVFIIVSIFPKIQYCKQERDFQNRAIKIQNPGEIIAPSENNKSARELEVKKEFSRAIELANPRMNGTDVLDLQKRLLFLGFTEIGEADGYYGPLTDKAIKSIQTFSGYVSDGKIDRTLWDFIFSDENTYYLQYINGTISACEQNENYFETDGKGHITAYKGSVDSISIPALIRREKITAIGQEVFTNKNLRRVIIPDSITSIGLYAFSGNPLTIITIGANVKLGYNFEWDDPDYVPYGGPVYDDGITSFTTSFDYYCYNSNGMKAGTYVYSDKRWSVDGKTIVVFNDLDILVDAEGTIISAYYNRTYNNDLIIPEQIRGIQVTAINKARRSVLKGRMLFTGMGLTSVTIPASVTSIGSGAFRDNQLTSVSIGANVELGQWDNKNYLPSFDDGFDDFYNSNGKKAAWYIYNNGHWVIR